MNYRHAYHAGNFADVMKHIVLTRVIEHLKRKAKPFRYVDTHAGVGMYDLSGDEAQRSGEWRRGIGMTLKPGELVPKGVQAGSELADLLTPYFDVLRSVNGGARNDEGEIGAAVQGLRFYPGSGLFASKLMRADDRLVLNELHPDDGRALRRTVVRDERVRTLELDGWMTIKSVLPPKERRGVLLVDPPFEVAAEFKRLETALDDATARFATGVTLLWYPIKEGGAAAAFLKRMTNSGHSRLLAAELLIRHRDTAQGLNGAGLLIHNPPYGLDEQISTILPWIANCLELQPGSGWRVVWISGE
jgi:23S rRNA (adenine2030-N6)-methyltransferase